MTESVMALPHGSPVAGSDSPRASARAKVKQSVAQRDRIRRSEIARIAGMPRRIARVMYLDAADSWIVHEQSPSLRTVWATDYAAAVPGGYAPFRYWCQAWKPVAIAVTVLFDGPKWLLIHPVRGPFTLTLTGAAITAAYL